MNKYLSKALFTVILTITGCSSAPDLAPLLSMPKTPNSTSNSISSVVTLSNTYDITDNVVQSGAHTIKAGSTVVINVPDKIFERTSKQETDDEFRTAEFFNYAEQEIERELIRHGFSVLSRSKFEAKLRDLRDETSCKDKWWRCPASKVDSEVQTILDELEESFKEGKISAIDFAKQTKKFKSEMQISSTGRSRQEGDRELTDISEVIRAAQSGSVQSDYILQINNFDTNRITNTEVNLLESAEIRAYLLDNPSVKQQFIKKQYLTCQTEGAELNAKLIHVSSGAIVWIGKHEVNELNSGVTNLEVQIGEHTFVNNINEVKQFVSLQNSYGQRINRYGKQVSVPTWKYSKDLIGPNVISGRCNEQGSQNRVDKNTRTKLARSVSKELIREIVVSK